MPTEYREVSIKGKAVKLPAYTVSQNLVVIGGKWLRIARFHEEEWLENIAIDNLDAFLIALKKAAPTADIFTFAQELTETNPKYPFPFEEDDVAAVHVTTFKEWWEALPQESRKNVRKAEKRGVVTNVVPLDDALAAGIKSIYDESPVRQGRRFWHYGKSLEAVKRENSTYIDRSDFVAAYLEGNLIGFIKIVRVGKVGRIMQIISKNAHADKKTPNALLAKAVEVCAQRGLTHFIYGKYFYGTKGHTPITEFKRRNGFQRIVFPRYFVPLTLKGRVAVRLKLHLGATTLLPPKVTKFLLDTRARLLSRRDSARTPAAKLESEKETNSS